MSSLEAIKIKESILEIAQGNVPGKSIIQKYGRNDTVPNGTWELISMLSAIPYFPAAVTSVRVKAGNAADTAAGAGAQKITVYGIKSDLTEDSVSIVTNGTSASASSLSTWWRIYRAYVADASCGTYGGANTGQVIIENAAGTQDLISIAAGEGQSQFCSVSVPTAVKFYLHSITVTVNASKPADVKLMMRRNFNDVSTPYEPVRLMRQWGGIQGEVSLHIDFANSFEPLTDIWMEARGGGAATDVTADMTFVAVTQ